MPPGATTLVSGRPRGNRGSTNTLKLFVALNSVLVSVTMVVMSTLVGAVPGVQVMMPFVSMAAPAGAPGN